MCVRLGHRPDGQDFAEGLGQHRLQLRRQQDYVPHHDPFQYDKSTANPKHLPPSSAAAIGRTDQANHQYDLSLLYKTLQDGNIPAVSFLKAAAYQDGHAGYSNPIDEQHFLVNTINQIEQSKYWKSTAIVITYDDSDGSGSATASTTPSRAACTRGAPCSTSAAGRISGPSSSTRPPGGRQRLVDGHAAGRSGSSVFMRTWVA